MTRGLVGVACMKLEVGTSITIETDFTNESQRFKSKVLDIESDHIMIDYPIDIETGRTAYIIDGTQVVVTFIDKQKMSFAFQSEVLGRVKRNIPMLQLTYSGDDHLLKIQRREFVRVETAVDVAVEKNGVYYQLTTEDISAGGLALLTAKKVELEENETINLMIVLPFSNNDIKYVRTKARVVRSWEKDGRYVSSLMFEEMSSKDCQHIIRFCFERQLVIKNELKL